MLYITFNVYKQKIKRTDTQHIVADSRNYLKASFTFSDDDWTGIKTAIFKNGDVVKHAILDDNNECLVPWEVIKLGILHVSVFCGDLITADTATVYINESGYEDGGTPEAPSPTVYEQIIAMLNEIETGGIPDDKIAAAVQAYLAEHPVETLTEEDVQRIVSEYVAAHKDELKGEKGNTGNTPNFTIGTVETLPSGSDATATITGDKENPVLNLGIPKGTNGKSAYEIAKDNGFTGTEVEWIESLKASGVTEEQVNEIIQPVSESVSQLSNEIKEMDGVTTKILIDTLYSRNRKDDFAWRDMPCAQIALIIDDCLANVISLCVTNAKAKDVPLNMSAMVSHFDELCTKGDTTKTVVEEIRRGVKNGGEVLQHGNGTITISNIDNEDYLKKAFLTNKENFISYGFNPRCVILDGGQDAEGNSPIYNDARTDRWVRALFDFSDGYGIKEPYNHIRNAPTTLEQAKSYIDSAVANKSFCPIFAHKWYDFWDEMIDYAKSLGANFTTYSEVYDTYGTTKSLKAMETRIKVLEQGGGGKVLASISATKTKTSYTVDDSFSTDDIIVIAHYSDETSEVITSDATINTSNVVMSVSGKYNISISYGGKSTSIEITVSETSSPSGTVIYEVSSISGTCNGTSDVKVGSSSTSWTSGKQYQYEFDYEITAVQDDAVTVSIRDCDSNELKTITNATVGASGHINTTKTVNNTRTRQAFLLKNVSNKTYSVKLTNVTVTEL